MIKELVKLSNDFDNSGFYKEAERIDVMLKKISGLYKSKAEGSRWDDNASESSQWFKRDEFDRLDEREIAGDYLTKRFNLQVVDSPDEYIEYMEIQPWQEDKVRRAIQSNPPSANFRPEYLGKDKMMGQNLSNEDEDSIEVTNDHKLAMLIADKDSSVNYKMSNDTFMKIKSGTLLTFGDLTSDDFNNSVLPS